MRVALAVVTPYMAQPHGEGPGFARKRLPWVLSIINTDRSTNLNVNGRHLEAGSEHLYTQADTL